MPSRSVQLDAIPLLGNRGLGGEGAGDLLLAGVRTLIPKRLAACTASSVREPRSRQAIISVGSSDSDQTAFAVAPAGPSGPCGADDRDRRSAAGPSRRGTRRGRGGSSWSAADNMMRAACASRTKDSSARLASPRHGGPRGRRLRPRPGRLRVRQGERLRGQGRPQLRRGRDLRRRAARAATRWPPPAPREPGTAASATRARTSTSEPRLATTLSTRSSNGGFSGAIMPQNIVVGDEAEQVAASSPSTRAPKQRRPHGRRSDPRRSPAAL